MKYFTFIAIVALFLSGCNEASISEQRKECLEEGKKFKIEKILNYRTGEFRLQGHCK